MRTEVIRARIEPKTKRAFQKVIKSSGLSMSDTINLLVTNIVETRKFPFELKVPNEKTLAAMHELEEGRGHKYNNMSDVWEDIK